MVKFKVVRLCKQEAMSIAPVEVVRYDLDRAAAILEEKGYHVNNQGLMVVALKGEREITLYTNGRMLVSRADSKELATEVASEIYEAVEGSRESFPPRRS